MVYLLAGALDGRRVDNALLDSVVREVGLQLEKGGIYLSRSVAAFSVFSSDRAHFIGCHLTVRREL